MDPSEPHQEYQFQKLRRNPPDTRKSTLTNKLTKKYSMFVDKKYLIFDLDGTLIESNRESEAVVFSHILRIPGINRELAEKIYHSTF